MKKKFELSDSKKILLIFLGVSIALIISFSLLIAQSDSTTDKHYEYVGVPELTIQNQIVNFIKLSNTLTLDHVGMTNSITNTYHILTEQSALKFSNYAKDNKIFDNFGNITREVYINELPQKVDKSEYEVAYKVLTREFSGLLLSNISYKATISAKVLHPSISDITDNPLGIYITDFNIKTINKEEI